MEPVTTEPIAARMAKLERRERAFFDQIAKQMEAYLRSREYDHLHAFVRKELERIKDELRDEMRYERITVDVKHIVNGEEV